MSAPNEPPRDGVPLLRPPIDREVENEVAFHIAMRVRDLVARGTPAADAERIAVAEFGDVGHVMKECRTISHRRERQMKRIRAIGELAQDVAFAFRLLRRRPAFAALATATIALGIGAATSIFSVVDGVLLRALPFADPDRLVAVWIAQPSLASDPVVSGLATQTVLGAEEFVALRDHTTAFKNVALWQEGSAMLVGPTATEPVRTVRATASLLDVLGERMALGRGFVPDENTLNGAKVALASWETWTARFGSDSAIVGKRIQLGDNTYTIVGVLPQGLRLDRSASPAAFWTPALQSKYDQPEYHNRSFQALARLRPNATVAFAQAEAARAFRSATNDSTISARVTDWHLDQTKAAREPLFILLAASALLLGIGCVNVAMLMLGEAASRERELAARIALGASRGRIVRQLLAESMTIAFAGAALGAALAWTLTRTLVTLAPVRLPGIDSAGVDVRALLFATACAATAGLLFGLTPALSLTRASESALLRVGTGQSARHGRRAQRWLVAIEVSLSFVLLFGAVLLARSLQRVTAVDPGFRPDNLIAVSLAAPSSFHDDDARMRAYYEETVRRVAAIPGVETATAGANLPFRGNSSSSPIMAEGRVYERNRGPSTEQRSVLPEYFAMMGIPVRAGRTFTAADAAGAELVAVISDAAAKRDFPGESPVGRRVRYQGQLRRIVGVVGDVHPSRLTRAAGPAIYVPLRQYATGGISLVVRTSAELAAIAPALRAAVRGVDPAVSVSSIATMPSLVARSYAEERYRTVIVGVFALLAAILASVGLYGVTLRAVARRTREVAIRVALGATPGRATRLLMSETLIGVSLGLATAIPLALLAGARLTPYLFRITPRDPFSFAVVFSLLGIVALLATGLPARRAGRSNPAVTLSAD